MTFRKLKPETIERLKAQAIRERAEREADTLKRTKELADRDGPDSLWAELYADLLARRNVESLTH